MKITDSGPPLPNPDAIDRNRLLRESRVRRDLLENTLRVDYEVKRDLQTQRFVVEVLDPASREVLDQFPSESVLKQIEEEKD